MILGNKLETYAGVLVHRSMWICKHVDSQSKIIKMLYIQDKVTLLRSWRYWCTPL